MDASVTTARPPRGAAFHAGLALVLVAAAIVGAFAFQAAGYAPCELCLKERWPYYAGLILAAGTALLARQSQWTAARIGFVLLIALFLLSAGFGLYHSGVEWGWWKGPSDCTGELSRASTNADFLHQLQTIRVVRCDAVAIRILGLSLAGWNAVVSLIVAAIATAGLGRIGSAR